MEVAYTQLSTTPVGEIMAREAEDSRKKEQQTQAASLGDTVIISDEAREKQRAQAAGESEDNKSGTEKDKETGGYGSLNNSSSSGDTAAASGSSNGPESEVEKIQRQIRDVQKKIADATNKLSASHSAASSKASAAPEKAESGQGAAEAEEAAALGSATPPMPGAAIAEGEQDAQAIQAEISQLNDQLMRLNQQLQDASKGDAAGGGYRSTAMRSVAGSRYSGSGGGAANVSIGGGHIG